MFKTQVEPQAAGEWFHCKVLNILWGHCRAVVHESVDHGKLWSICFFTKTFIFLRKQLALRDMLRHFHGLFSHRP